jgi:hypothetical protein
MLVLLIGKPSGCAAARAERLCLSDEPNANTFLRLSLRKR